MFSIQQILQQIVHHPILLTAFYYDILATLVVFCVSFLFNNSSFYDPYWSVVPIPLAFYFSLHPLSSNVSPTRKYLLLALVVIWGTRLTYNFWGRVGGSGGRFGYGSECEDWRYRMFRQLLGRFLYWPFSLICFHLIPTLITFLGCCSLFEVFINAEYPFNFIDVIAFVVTSSAILIEGIADYQLTAFMKTKRREGEILTSGLWRYSRHPNYFGEISFWWGLFFFALASRGRNALWTILGPISVTILFIFSTQLLETRMSKRKGYDVYQRTTSLLIPFFPKVHQK